MLNTIPLRVKADGPSDVGSWLRAVYRSSIESLKHHHFSTEDIVQSTRGSDILKTVFAFENYASRLDSSIFSSLQVQSIDSHKFSNMPLTIILEFVESRLMITFKFNEAVLPN
jgi:hypothetical protein